MLRYTVLVLFSIFVVTYSQSLGLPLNTGQGGGGGRGGQSVPTCKYEFTVPDLKGGCNRASSSLSNKVDAIKQDLDKTRLQYVAQNSIIQSTLARIQGDSSKYMSQVQDLSKEVSKLQNALNTVGTGGGVSSANSQYINKLVHDTKDLLTKSVQDINNKIYNLTYQFQNNAIQESKVNTALEVQINKQASLLSQTEQKILNLENQLKNIQSKPSNTVTVGATGQPATNIPLSQLQQQYKKLESDIKYIQSQQQSQFQGLQSKTNNAILAIQNQSHEIDTVKQDTKAALSQIQAATKQAKDAKDAIDQFKQKYEPEIQINNAEIQEIQRNITGVTNTLSNLGSTILNNKVQSLTDKAKLNGVVKSAEALQNTTKDLTNQIKQQSAEMLNLKLALNQLNTSGSGGGSGGGNNVALQQQLNSFQSKTQSKLNATEAALKQVQNMVTTLLAQITPLLTRPGSG